MTMLCLPDAGARDHVGALPPGIDVMVWDGRSAVAGLADVEMLVPAYTLVATRADALARFGGLRVVQLLSAGVESWLGRVPEGVMLCSGRGIHGASTAELAIAGMLAVLRELPHFQDEQRAHSWRRRSTDCLDGKRVLVVGAGDIGRRVAAAVEPLGAQPTLVGRRPRDGVRAAAELPALIAGHDVVVLAVPRTAETDGLVDAAFLAAMPDGALLVNVSRGSVVETTALVAELRSGRLRAFLDVADPEPPPPDHPLWDVPNLVLTPHIGGGTRGWERRAYGLVHDQVIRFHNGQALENVVSGGY